MVKKYCQLRNSKDEEVFRAVSAGSTDFRPRDCFHVIHDPNVTGKEEDSLPAPKLSPTRTQI